MRAIKRIRYGEKELQRLKEMVAKTEEKEATESGAIKKLTAQSMETDSAVQIVKKTKVPKSSDLIEMETDESKTGTHKKKTMLDKNGQYPGWMNSRRLKKQRTLVKRLKNKKKK